ncbi:MAG TPA: UDP-N-acetylmuramate dehydrogenase [Stellaceae bacterium]|jgi:UDP-N-acetylmuramate dehydrogenase
MIALEADLAMEPAGTLPGVRGRLIADAPIGRQTWFGAGGRAEMLFRPADRDDLAALLRALPPELPATVIGGGSNVLIRDGGVAGVTIRLGRAFAGIALDGTDVVAGAGALHLNLALAASAAGIAGLEFLSGIPGTLGGGLRMNAGAYGREVRDVLVEAAALDRGGEVHVIAAAAMGFAYRHCGVDADWILIGARLRGEPGKPEAINRRIGAIRQAREVTQPIRSRTGGSTFKNPPGDAAWRLIDAAGCRGLTRGGAMVSPQHANFLVNAANATAADLEGLGEEVRRRVYESCGVALEWEIRRIGQPLAEAKPIAAGVPTP